MNNEPEPDIPEQAPLAPVYIRLNAGFGRPSHIAKIESDHTMIIPDGLVRELNYQAGDGLKWEFDADEGIMYVRVVRSTWKAPEWLEEE